jgi:hypothetical protein
MATSQRLVDPSRQFAVPTSYSWKKSYQAALLETDWTKMQERVQRAESEIHQRRLVLSQDHSGTDEERTALVNAMSALRVAASCRKPVQNERQPFPLSDMPNRAG